MRKVSAALMIYNLTATAALASYDSGGLGVNGNFSANAYGGEKYQYRLHEYIDTVPAPRLAVRPVKAKHQNVQLASLEEPKNLIPPQPPVTTNKEPNPIVVDKPVISEQNEVDAKAQNLLIDKVLVSRAYAIRKKEGIKEWTCMAESGKMMLAHVEAQFGKMDITTDGTCADRNIAGTGVKSQHAFGRAIDFHPNKKHSKKEIVAWLIDHRKEGWVSGIMTYREMTHIHIDCGPYHFVALASRG